MLAVRHVFADFAEIRIQDFDSIKFYLNRRAFYFNFLVIPFPGFVQIATVSPAILYAAMKLARPITSA